MVIGIEFEGEKILKVLRNRIQSLPQLIKDLQSSYFYREELVKALLFERDLCELPSTKFIHYSKYLDYYPGDAKAVAYKLGDEEKSVRLPYKEEINFIKEPDARIAITNEDDISDYVMSSNLEQMTQRNLEEFLRHKPNTYDQTVLRLASLDRCTGADYKYECRLELSSYYRQVRTNLTLDYPLEYDSTKTLRVLDMGRDNRLPPLQDSRLVNSIGVSAVVYFQSNSKRFFFMKLRRDSEGVFENMLGSTSGVMEYVKGGRIRGLVSYAEQEMRREFIRETGLDDAPGFIKHIIPLALARELTRGGKPQFFFLIEVKEVSEKEAKVKFRKSPEGMVEFYDDLIRNRAHLRSALSPEFAANLVYAFQYFQHAQNFPLNPVRLDT